MNVSSLWCIWNRRYSFLPLESWKELINLLPFTQLKVSCSGNILTLYNLFLLKIYYSFFKFVFVHPLAACHILECRSGMAQDVISTIGQAFELRFKQYLKNPSLNTSCERSAKRSIIIWLTVFILFYFKMNFQTNEMSHFFSYK